jgi:deoxyribonuclease V
MFLNHAWDLTPKKAIQLQNKLRPQTVIQPLKDEGIRHIAGVDVGFPKGKEIARAAVVVLTYPALERVDQAVAEIPLTFPYVPGLLSFREIPAILASIAKLTTRPDALITDGHGLAHPRRFGLACHLGVLLDLPAIGCGKSLLVGEYHHLGEERGSTSELVDQEEVIGAAVRTRDRVKPIFVSVGHKVDLPSAVRVVLTCGGGYRLPEPTRWADRLASQRWAKG